MLQLDFVKQLGHLQLNVNLTIPAQGMTAIFGLSGSGKTSLINVISGLITPDQGKVVLNDRTLVDIQQKIHLPANKRHIGYVFQEARLFPHYRVKGNLLYGMEKPYNMAEFKQIIQLLGIEHLLKCYPITLSGGEKQRVAIGRALLSQPEMLLMDEPLSALDLPRKRELMDYLETLTKKIQIPILYVTHNLDELARLADRVILLENGQVLAYDSLDNIWKSERFSVWRSENTLNLLSNNY